MWFYYPPGDYSTLSTKRARKCSSCGERIAVGDLCCKFDRRKVPEHDIEVRIWGEDGEIPLAPCFICERCGDLYWSMSDLGFECVGPHENMLELVREYATTYGKGGMPPLLPDYSK
jgi:hypothetical protein